MFMELYDVRPGISSQTTSAIEEVVVQDSLSLSFFDVNAPRLEMAHDDTWDEIARRVLQEYTDLWERLANL